MGFLFFGGIWVVASLLCFLDKMLKDFLSRG